MVMSDQECDSAKKRESCKDQVVEVAGMTISLQILCNVPYPVNTT